MNNEELRNKCSAFELKENRKPIFNHNYSSFIINYSFYKWHLVYTVFIVRLQSNRSDINLLRDFRYVPMELDMPDGSICCLAATRFISYRVRTKRKHIDKKYWQLNLI